MKVMASLVRYLESSRLWVYNGNMPELSRFLGIVHGDFPKRALRHVLEWYDLHKDELIEDWILVQAGKPPKKILPLE